jgi:filamin
VLREVTTHFIVDTRALSKAGGGRIKVHVINPSGGSTETFVTDKGDGTYRVEYTAFEDGEERATQSGAGGSLWCRDE